MGKKIIFKSYNPAFYKRKGWILAFRENDAYDFEVEAQDACLSLVILSECFSMLARWRGQCWRGRKSNAGSQSVGKLSGLLGCRMFQKYKNGFFSKSQVLGLLCSEETHIHTVPLVTVIEDVFNGRTCFSSLSRRLHPSGYARVKFAFVTESGTFLRDSSPVHLIMRQLFCSFRNVKADAEWNRLEMMKVI